MLESNTVNDFILLYYMLELEKDKIKSKIMTINRLFITSLKIYEIIYLQL
jgi:hypothetical protein